MARVFLDPDFKCHVAGNDTMNTVDTDFLDGKRTASIEGCRFVSRKEI